MDSNRPPSLGRSAASGGRDHVAGAAPRGAMYAFLALVVTLGCWGCAPAEPSAMSSEAAPAAVMGAASGAVMENPVESLAADAPCGAIAPTLPTPAGTSTSTAVPGAASPPAAVDAPVAEEQPGSSAPDLLAGGVAPCGGAAGDTQPTR